MAKNRENWGRTPWKISYRAKLKSLPPRVDFAIVGAGFTGLTAAACLARMAPHKSVLVLEAGSPGNGASGRTGGMALAQTAAGDLPGLGDVLRGYRKILRELNVKSDLLLPGVWELARGTRSMDGKKVRPMKRSPLQWNDLGTLQAVGQVPGGSINPGKVVSGLARAAKKAGVEIADHALVEKLEFLRPLRLRVRRQESGGFKRRTVAAEHVLVAANAGSLELGDTLFSGKRSAEPKLTFAIATAPLGRKKLAEIGLGSRRPFYTVDLPYLWGRVFGNDRLIFGSGLVPGFGESVRENKSAKRNSGVKKVWSGLEALASGSGEPAERLQSLARRVRGLHPALQNVRITHRWGGPILIMKDFLPVFRRHPRSENVLVLGGYSGHGVALSVYLGHWAAQVLLGRRGLPEWPSSK